jgi:hypothetical protein
MKKTVLVLGLMFLVSNVFGLRDPEWKIPKNVSKQSSEDMARGFKLAIESYIYFLEYSVLELRMILFYYYQLL